METKLDVEYDLVFIIDCLSQKEREDYKLSESLMKMLASNGIKQLQSLCINKAMLLDTFTYMKNLADTGLKLCLQIVSHGDERGLLIDDEIIIYWEEFRSSLYELNSKLDNTLIINMTTCKGLYGMKIVDYDKKEYPFFGIIGCNRDLYVWEAEIANKMFYSKLLEGKDISNIIQEIQQQFKGFEKPDDLVIYGISSQGYKSLLK